MVYSRQTRVKLSWKRPKPCRQPHQGCTTGKKVACTPYRCPNTPVSQPKPYQVDDGPAMIGLVLLQRQHRTKPKVRRALSAFKLYQMPCTVQTWLKPDKHRLYFLHIQLFGGMHAAKVRSTSVVLAAVCSELPLLSSSSSTWRESLLDASS